MNIPEKRQFPLTPLQLTLAISVKIILACLYGYLFLRFYGGDDTWAMNQEGILQAELLKSNPVKFFSELAPAAGIRGYEGLAFIQHYFSDLEFYLQAKTLAVFNLLTGGNYYLNAALFVLVSFWGPYWLFLLLNDHFPGRKKLLFSLVFLFLPVVFWLSGIRSDAYLFFFLSMLLLCFSRSFQKTSLLHFAGILIGFTGTLIFRAPYALLLVPALLSWWLVVESKKRISVAFIAIYGICLLVFFGSYYFSPEHAGTQYIVGKQQEFFALEGNTRYALDSLDAAPSSFIKILPEAMANTILRPYPGEAKGMLQFLSVLENVFVLIVLALPVLFIFLYRRYSTRYSPRWQKEDFLSIIETLHRPFFWAMLMFCLSLYLLIGYIVPFPGAIVRYRAIPELILLCLLLSTFYPLLVNWLHRNKEEDTAGLNRL